MSRLTHLVMASRRLLLCLPAALLILSLPLNSMAQEQQKERETKQTVAMSQKVFEMLTSIQEQLENKQYAEAESQLREAQQNEKLSPYEKAQVWNLTGYSDYLQEKYPEAIEAYKNVMKQPDLPEGLQQSTLKTMAQLQFTIEDYATALKTIQQLISIVPEPAADVYMLLGQAYFQLGDYKKALDPIKKAVDMFKAQGKQPRENWLLLLRVCYYQMEDYPKMIDVLKELIQYYPKDTYLLTLAGAYSELGDTAKQLAIVETLYDKGLITSEAHIVNLANLFLLHEVPYKAAVLLEKEMADKRVETNVRNLRLLSQAWYSARNDEKSIPPLKQAADMSHDGELYVRLAQSYINLEQWDEAADALREGLKIGGLNREDTAQIMLGMALFNQKKLSLARKAFEAALPDKRSHHTAQQWIAYVDSEEKRQELMNQKVPTENATPKKIDQLLKDASQGG